MIVIFEKLKALFRLYSPSAKYNVEFSLTLLVEKYLYGLD